MHHILEKLKTIANLEGMVAVVVIQIVKSLPMVLNEVTPIN